MTIISRGCVSVKCAISRGCVGIKYYVVSVWVLACSLHEIIRVFSMYNMRGCVDNLEIIRVFGMHNMCFVFHSHDGKGFFVR